MAIEAAFIVPHPPLIIPSVGKGQERGISKTVAAYRKVACRIADIAPDTIVVSSPHATLYRDYFHVSPGAHAKGDMGRFYVWNERLEVDYDEEFVAALCAATAGDGFPAGTGGEREPELDHATFIPLWFVNQAYAGYRAVRVGLSGLDALDHYQLGVYIADVAERLGRRTVYIASGDLSHVLKADGPYGFEPEGPRFDEQVTQAMADGDFERFLTFDEDFCDAAAECGLRSFQIMAGALDGRAVTHELLSYEGPFGVGYAVAAFEVTGEDPDRRFGQRLRARMREEHDDGQPTDPYVDLARLSVETYVTTGRPAKIPEGLPDEMLRQRAGAFVSLKEHGRLRGCIGTIAPTTSCVADEIVNNGIAACSRDPRFSPVRPDELPDLVYSVDVLGDVEPVDSPDELDVRRYGVIVENGGRRGLLLPNLEGVFDVDQQIAIAKQKAGIDVSEPCRLSHFEVVRHT
ncbi:MAG: AmmeMemoRadiSam system protein A [Coriobacteriales bacterium]